MHNSLCPMLGRRYQDVQDAYNRDFNAHYDIEMR